MAILNRFWSEVSPRALIVVLSVLVGVDLAGDLRAGAGIPHVLVELVILTTLGAGFVRLILAARATKSETMRLTEALALAHGEAQRWRSEARNHLDGLADAIDSQFARWQLTPSEREVGLLLLKGLSHKEIASIRSTNEQTVRSQAFALYRKASLRGRHDLSAFFLEDLLLPSGTLLRDANAS